MEARTVLLIVAITVVVSVVFGAVYSNYRTANKRYR